MGAQRVERKRRDSNAGGAPPWALVVGGLVLGLVLGLLYAWVLDPVEYSNADPGDLAPGAQRAWVEMTADYYALTDDADTARARLQFFQQDEVQAMLGTLLSNSQGDLAREQRLQKLAELLNSQPLQPGDGTVPEPAEGGSPLGTLLMACGFGLLALVLFGAIAVAVTRWQQNKEGRPRRRTPAGRTSATTGAPPQLPGRQQLDEPEATALAEEEDGVQILDSEDEGEFDLEDLFAETADAVEEAAPAARRAEFVEPEVQEVSYSPALAEFVTRYTFGDDGFDMSFPIETPQTEFLGECGVGIGDYLNEGSPQEVDAFEVWLFDKDDIRTVTKVLLTPYAWDNEELRSRLAPKGELVRAEEGSIVDLETKSLRVRARIREVAYGEGDGAPAAYFDRFVVELTAQQKQ